MEYDSTGTAWTPLVEGGKVYGGAMAGSGGVFVNTGVGYNPNSPLGNVRIILRDSSGLTSAVSVSGTEIDENVYIYVAPTYSNAVPGDDTSGTGSQSAPFATVGKVFEHIGTYASSSFTFRVRLLEDLQENTSSLTELTVPSGKRVTLESADTYAKTLSKARFTASGSGTTLTLANVTLNATGTGSTDDTGTPGVSLYDGASFVMDAGAAITNYSGSAVLVSGGTFRMNGGEITGNLSQSGDAGGVIVSGGSFTMSAGAVISDNTGVGVGVIGGSFTMSGGTIGGNSGYTGGGVYVSSGSFTMTGGTIGGTSANTATQGAGVYAGGGTVKLSGGSIQGNTASSVMEQGGGLYVGGANVTIESGFTLSGNTAGTGGGVYVASGSLTMTGGEISGNKTNTYGSSTEGYGGGVFVDGSGSFTMSGGTISGNWAFSDTSTLGGGVYVGGTFTVSGAAKVTGNTLSSSSGTANNVYLPSGKKITIGGALTGGEDSIGVTTEDAVTGNAVQITSGAADATAFMSDAGHSVVSAGKPDGGTAVFLSDAEAEYTPSGGTAQLVSFDTALSQANASGGTIKMLKGISSTTISAWPITFSGTNITLDLNGKTIDRGLASDSATANGNVITVSSGATVTIKDSLTGGTITGGNNSTDGGGIIVNARGSLRMEGGTISSNQSEMGGGGVYVAGSGSFTMSGSATISGNTVTDTAYNGGGVHVANGGEFTMSNGSISGGNSARNGGGVYVAGGGTFNMSGGEITGNNVTSGLTYPGGGVCVDTSISYGDGTFNVSGAPKIKGNTYNNSDAVDVGLADGVTITIAGALTDSAEIYVWRDPTTGTAGSKQIAVGSGVSTDDTTAGYFKSDDSDVFSVESDNSGVYLSKVEAIYQTSLGGTATYTSFAKALELANASGGIIDLQYDIDGTNAVFASGPITFTGTNITLNLNNYTINRGLTSETSNGNVITVNNGCTLTLNGSYGTIKGGNNSSGAGGISVGGTLNMRSGIIGNNFGYMGGGVYVGATGTFNMSGGTIGESGTPNTATDGAGVYVAGGTFEMTGGTISYNTSSETLSSGGGVYVDSGTFTMIGTATISNNAADSGGGVYMAGGTFTMSGGTIGGSGTPNFADNGAGVYVAGGTFEMSGGTISHNTAGSTSTQSSAQGGGGVYVASGSTFTMSGSAEISNNTVDSSYLRGGGVNVAGTFNMNAGTISSNSADNTYGGGVYVAGTGNFTMTDGIIGDSGAANTASYGAGVCIGTSSADEQGGSFTMNGGTISHNGCTSYGGGVYKYGGTFTVSGAPTVASNTNTTYSVDSNVYLPSGNYIAIGAAGLTSGAEIGVTTLTAPTSGNPVQITDGASSHSASSWGTNGLGAQSYLVPDDTTSYYTATITSSNEIGLYVNP